jgi:hypothetical protein
LAGFFNKQGGDNQDPLSKINGKFDGLLVKNSKAIGYIQGEMSQRGNFGDSFFDYSLALADTTSRYRTKSIAFFNLDYQTKRQKLRDLASNAEIDFVIDNIANDVIVYDQNNMFCHPADIRKALRTRSAIRSMKDEKIDEEQLMNEYMDTFDDIYSAWGFDNGITAWQMFYQYLIDGSLAYEIIYDNPAKPKRIISFKELDPATLYPIGKQDSSGGVYIEWVQRVGNDYRTLGDNQIIYIQYSSNAKSQRISFVEGMVRPFNVLRLTEYSKIMWHMMYGAVRLNTQIPIGTKMVDRAKEEMREYMNLFKEDIHFNQDTGEMLVDGQPKLHYFKNYVTPVNKSGESIKIEPMTFEGPDLQDSQLLNYFFKQLKLCSKLPFSRWDYNEGGGSYLMSPDSVTREENAYTRFIDRLRTHFCEVMTKPIYIQMCLNNDLLKKNTRLRNMIGIKYNDEKIFERMKKSEINERGAKTVKTLYEMKDENDLPKFDLDLLMREYMDLSEEFLHENDLAKAKKKVLKPNSEFGGEGAQAQPAQAQAQPAQAQA